MQAEVRKRNVFALNKLCGWRTVNRSETRTTLILNDNLCPRKKDEKNPKWDIGLEGMFGFAVGKYFYTSNIGRPSLMLKLNSYMLATHQKDNFCILELSNHYFSFSLL